MPNVALKNFDEWVTHKHIPAQPLIIYLLGKYLKVMSNPKVRLR
mgnify:CR=1 FL=1